MTSSYKARFLKLLEMNIKKKCYCMWREFNPIPLECRFEFLPLNYCCNIIECNRIEAMKY